MPVQGLTGSHADDPCMEDDHGGLWHHHVSAGRMLGYELGLVQSLIFFFRSENSVKGTDSKVA